MSLTPITDRIRAHGGEVIRDKWKVQVRRGNLSAEALAWVGTRMDDLIRETWPLYDDWLERAAIREFDGGQDRAAAEVMAYQEVMAR